MKNVLIGAIVLLSSLMTYGQDDRNKLNLFVGTNIVDVRVPMKAWSFIQDWSQFDEDGNFMPAITAFGLEYYLGTGFYVGADFSVNKIKRNYAWDTGDPFVLTSYYSFDVSGKYMIDFKKVKSGEKRFIEPYVIVGLGVTSMSGTDNSIFVNQSTGLGANVWVAKGFGVRLQSIYKGTYKNREYAVFQHTIGVILPLCANSI